MERIQLEALKRDVIGKKVRFLRREGTTPANMYGHGLESVALKVDTGKLKQTLARAGKTDLISLQIDDSKAPVLVLIRNVQRNTLNDEFLHVDFYQVKMTEKIKVDVPLVFVGEAPVLDKVKNVSVLHLIDSLHIEALPDNLPHSLEVNISSLEELGSTIHVKDIHLGDGIDLLSDAEQMVVKVVEAKKEVEVAPVEAEVVEEVEGVAAEGAEAEAEEAKEE